MKAVAKAIAGSIAIFSMNAGALSLFQSDTYIDLGTNVYDQYLNPPRTADANTTTGIITEFGFTQFLATSVYDLSDGLLTGSFYDSNDTTVLGNLGIPTSGTAMDGVTTVTLALPSYPSQVNFDTLEPISGDLIGNDTEGFNLAWRLVAVYTLNGTLSAGGPSYTGGTIDIYFEEMADLAGAAGMDKFKVLTLSLTGSLLQAANLDLFFDVTYAKDNFFWVKNDNGVFVDAADGGVVATLDTNVNPPIPTLNQLLVLNDGNNAGQPAAVRQTTLDGTIGYRVPEPATLGLFGLGLLGLASIRRRSAHS